MCTQLTNNQRALSLPLEAFHSYPVGCPAGLDHQGHQAAPLLVRSTGKFQEEADYFPIQQEFQKQFCTAQMKASGSFLTGKKKEYLPMPQKGNNLKMFLNLFVLSSRQKKQLLKFIPPLLGTNPNKYNGVYKFTFESASCVSALLVTASFRTVHHPYASHTSFTFSVNQKMDAKIQNASLKIPLFFFQQVLLLLLVKHILQWGMATSSL